MTAFGKIKKHVLAGRDINEFDDREPVLYYFLDVYYQNNPNRKELRLPLEQRASGILGELSWLLSHGAKVNVDGERQPLMPPVGNLDAAMTAYLLENGANPHFDISEDEAPYGCGNFYIDDLDRILLDESFVTGPDQSVFDRVLQIAALFAKYGVAGVHTYCISIDKKTRTVSTRRVYTAF